MRGRSPAEGCTSKRLGFLSVAGLALLISFLAAVQPVRAQSLADLDSEHDPAKRAVHALSLAEQSFEQAKTAYGEGEIKKGDAHLDDMTKLLNACVAALESARRANLYKQAEIHVETLLRKLQSLTESISVDERGWAEYTFRQVDAIHDKLLSGVMKK
jgi:hypothetical protein